MSEHLLPPSTPLQIGRVLRADNTRCVVGCRAGQANLPVLGSLVRLPVEDAYQVYGLVANVQIFDDGLTRQVAISEAPDPSVVLDNQYNRNLPLEIGVLFVGYERAGALSHLLPPRPPLVLHVLYACTPEEVCRFTMHGRFGYFRHILRATDQPIDELLAAHLQQAHACHQQAGHAAWAREAARELITLLRDDYATLTTVLKTLADTPLDF
ncbi:hypothetical protein [uncultured Thermanaerothrix sp.]|uniref:hypothetical protein n=1 Tax=uncultured Thermanaerothrix sp. TaxID=1195149 RepID=UPI00262456BC|nr:hypothetical protein [uncultured Thermanaerothrix sp.]